MGRDLTAVAAAERSNVVLFAGAQFLIEPAGPLGAAIDALRRGVTVHPSPALLDQARHHLTSVLPLCAVARPERIVGWLSKLGGGLVNAPKPDDLPRSASALIEVCDGMPCGVWVPETRRAYWQRSKFWPAPAELYEHLLPFSNAIGRHRAGAEAIIRAGTALQGAEEAAPEPTQEVRDAVAAAWRARRAEIEAQRADTVRGVDCRHIAATPVSDALLLAVHERAAADGVPGSALRVEALRKKLGRHEAIGEPQLAG